MLGQGYGELGRDAFLNCLFFSLTPPPFHFPIEGVSVYNDETAHQLHLLNNSCYFNPSVHYIVEYSSHSVNS